MYELRTAKLPAKRNKLAIIETAFIGMDIATTLHVERLLGARNVGRLC